ncbi:unnamed protein product [Rhizoctonia solani]|uniref:Uncharacterized protein n=1 Tax=Rhizoctonia solani TaxID=456999 RepID=A0A8H2XG32_9AGAM|nr:unnamed protein product [Rhizoctonia solani]
MHNSLPSSNIPVLESVDESSLKMLLDITARKNEAGNDDGGPSSLEVDNYWILSILEQNEAVKPLTYNPLQEDGINGAEIPRAIKVQYTNESRETTGPRELIMEAMHRVKEEFNLPDGCGIELYGLGVGRKLSKLLHTCEICGDPEDFAMKLKALERVFQAKRKRDNLLGKRT